MEPCEKCLQTQISFFTELIFDDFEAYYAPLDQSLGPLPGPPEAPFEAFFYSFYRAPFWSVSRPSCCPFLVPQMLSLWPRLFYSIFLAPFPGLPELLWGLFPSPHEWDSIPSFLRTLFRSLPGTPGALFGPPVFDFVFLSPFFLFPPGPGSLWGPFWGPLTPFEAHPELLGGSF
jgi:hypothetical protein